MTQVNALLDLSQDKFAKYHKEAKFYNFHTIIITVTHTWQHE